MNTSSECLFCHELQSGSNVILETSHFFARWDQVPLVPGHAEVVPKRHVQYFEQLNDAEAAELIVAVQGLMAKVKSENLQGVYRALLEKASDYVAPHLERALEESRSITNPPDAFNHGINDGPAAGQTVPHLHYHLIPRWSGDVANPRGGIRRILGADEYSGDIDRAGD